MSPGNYGTVIREYRQPGRHVAYTGIRKCYTVLPPWHGAVWRNFPGIHFPDTGSLVYSSNNCIVIPIHGKIQMVYSDPGRIIIVTYQQSGFIKLSFSCRIEPLNINVIISISKPGNVDSSIGSRCYLRLNPSAYQLGQGRIR